MTRTLFVAFVVLLGLNLVDAAKKGVKTNRGGVSGVLSPLVDPRTAAHSAGAQSDAAGVAATGAAGAEHGSLNTSRRPGRSPGYKGGGFNSHTRFVSERERLQALRAARAASASQVIVAGGSFTVVRSILCAPLHSVAPALLSLSCVPSPLAPAYKHTHLLCSLSPACSLGAPVLGLRSLPPSRAPCPSIFRVLAPRRYVGGRAPASLPLRVVLLVLLQRGAATVLAALPACQWRRGRHLPLCLTAPHASLRRLPHCAACLPASACTNSADCATCTAALPLRVVLLVLLQRGAATVLAALPACLPA